MRIWTLLRYPHPPLNQSSYTIFSFHRLAGFLPHPASYFFALGVGCITEVTGLPRGRDLAGRSRRRGLFLEGQDLLATRLSAETTGEKLLQDIQEGVGREQLLQPHPVPQVG